MCGDRIICIVSILSVKVTNFFSVVRTAVIKVISCGFIVFNIWIMINRSIRAVCSGICLQYRFPIFTCQNTHRVICFNPLSKIFKSVTGCISSFSCKLSLDKNRILFSLRSKYLIFYYQQCQVFIYILRHSLGAFNVVKNLSTNSDVVNETNASHGLLPSTWNKKYIFFFTNL